MDKFFNNLYGSAGEYRNYWDAPTAGYIDQQEHAAWAEKTALADIWACWQCGNIPYCDKYGIRYIPKGYFD